MAELVGSWSSRSGGLLVVAQVFHHPMLFGALALTALAAAALIGVRSLAVRTLSVTAALLVTLLAVPVFLFGSSEHQMTMNEAAPNRSDRHLVVVEGAALIDPLWWVYIDEGSGLTKRRWEVGYFNGDASSNALVEASWMEPDRIRLVTGEGEDSQMHLVDLSPESGRPLRTLSMG
ncbi:hypothetical protein [Streptomyces poonensis]|uniref:hypothetical protein n=1 Tax=Streptomyces poonensis TaxID=68255 RepID=UPI001672D112|nr:hypothetical protein [Streptomyces poonensis]